MSEVIDSLARHLQERLAAKEAECTLLAAHNRKLEEGLRPFAEAYRAGLTRGIATHVPGLKVFARAAELVPESPVSDAEIEQMKRDGWPVESIADAVVANGRPMAETVTAVAVAAKSR